MKTIILLSVLAMTLSSCVVAARSDRPGQAAVIGGIGRASVKTVVVVPVIKHPRKKHCYYTSNRVYRCYYR